MPPVGHYLPPSASHRQRWDASALGVLNGSTTRRSSNCRVACQLSMVAWKAHCQCAQPGRQGTPRALELKEDRTGIGELDELGEGSPLLVRGGPCIHECGPQTVEVNLWRRRPPAPPAPHSRCRRPWPRVTVPYLTSNGTVARMPQADFPREASAAEPDRHCACEPTEKGPS